MEILKFSRYRRLLIALPFLMLLIYPFELTSVPAQSVLVVTEDMHPIKGALVRQNWQNYSLEGLGHRQDLQTSADGRVSFARLTIRANLISRVLGPFCNVLTQGVHASFGPHVQMQILDEGISNDNETTEPRPDEVVYRIRS